MKAEKREWEGKAVQDRELAAMKAVQDGELAAMEEREYGRHLEENQVAQDGELAAIEERERERKLEKNQGGVDDAEGGTGRERERTGGNGTKFELQMCVLSAAKRFFSAVNAGMGLRGFE